MDIIYENVDIWLLMFGRILFTMMFAPIFVDVKVPPTVVAGVSGIMAIITLMTLGPVTLVYNPTLLGFGMLFLKEAIVGIVMAFSVSIFFQVYHFAGSLISTQGGLSMSTIFDSASNAQTTLVGKIYYMQFCAVFVITGGLQWFIKSIVDSFKFIPVGNVSLNSGLMEIIIKAIGMFWVLGFQISAPILAVIIILDCGMGILARAVPQMNMFVIGIPLKLIVMLIMMLLTAPLIESFNNLLIDSITDILYAVVQGMVP